MPDPYDSAMWYIVLRVLDERDANKALELVNKVYSLWWDVNSLLHGKEVAEKIASGNAPPGDVKIWQQVYGSMSPQQIDQLIQQKLRELQDAENQLRQILSKYASNQQEINNVINNIKVSIPYKHPKAEQLLGSQSQQQQQSSQGSSQQSVSTAVVSVSAQKQQQQAQQKQAQQSQQQQSQGNQQSTGSTQPTVVALASQQAQQEVKPPQYAFTFTTPQQQQQLVVKTVPVTKKPLLVKA